MSAVELQTRAPDDGQVAQIADLLGDWTETVGLRLRASLRLAMAETRLAITTFALMIFLSVLSAGAVAVAWGLVLLALIQALSLAGLALLSAALVIGGLHLVLAWALWRLANRLSRHMEFRATRSLLRNTP